VEDALVRFETDVERFARSSNELHDALKNSLENSWAAGKLWALHSDVVAGCWQFADAYRGIVDAPDEEPASPRSVYGRSEHQRLVVATKALIFFVRGYQDGLAGAARVAGGGTWGAYPSMRKELTRHALIQELVHPDTNLSEYREWFEEWRDVRNMVKLGIGQVSRAVPGRRVQIDFWTVGRDGGPGRLLMSLRMSGVQKAMWLSGTFSRMIARRIGLAHEP
jgi:hypothetical protein